MKLIAALCFLGMILVPFLARADALDQWMTRTSPVPVILRDVIYAKGLFVAIGEDTSSNIARLIVSSNGTDWVRFASQSRMAPRSLAYGTNGLFVGVGNVGFSFAYGADTPGVIISTNGTNWSFFQTFGTGLGPWTNFESVAYGNGLFVAVGEIGTVATSADGTNWATHATPTFSPLSAIAYGNGVWVAAGPRVSDGSSADTGGPGLISLDATNWVQLDAEFNGSHLLFARGMFLAIPGDTFTPNLAPMRYSLDGTNWFNISEPAVHVMNRATYGGGLFTAVGRGLIKTSFDGTNWVLRHPANPDATNRLRSVAFGANTFVAVGDVILQSEDIRPHLRVEVVPNPSPPDFDHRLYLRGLSNAAYAIEVSGNLTNWGQRVAPQTATGGDDLFYIYSGSSGQGFRRARQVP